MRRLCLFSFLSVIILCVFVQKWGYGIDFSSSGTRDGGCTISHSLCVCNNAYGKFLPRAPSYEVVVLSIVHSILNEIDASDFSTLYNVESVFIDSSTIPLPIPELLEFGVYFNFLHLDHLEELRMTNCGLTDDNWMPVQSAHHLVRLSLSGNRLTRIPRLHSPCMLRVLDLSRNAISHIGQRDLNELERLQELDLSSNGLGAAFDAAAFAGARVRCGWGGRQSALAAAAGDAADALWRLFGGLDVLALADNPICGVAAEELRVSSLDIGDCHLCLARRRRFLQRACRGTREARQLLQEDPNACEKLGRSAMQRGLYLQEDDSTRTLHVDCFNLREPPSQQYWEDD